MTLPASGLIKLSQIAFERQLPLAGFRLTQAESRALAGVPIGQISLSNFYGKTYVIEFLISANMNDITLFNMAGSPTRAGVFRFTINPGVIIGQVSAAYSLDVGQFPSGSSIVIVNNGSIQAKGGAANGGNGYNAIKSDYPNQNVTINNMAGSSIYAGGGGGGAGGAGGHGGVGGTGYYTYAQPSGGGVTAIGSSCSAACANYYGGNYGCYSGCSSTPVCTTGVDDKGNCPPGYNSTQYTCATCYYTATAYTSGGAGGGGGYGGSGGRGQGCDANAMAGSPGAGGAGGAAGGTNAGAGGTGGTGGYGGNGGGWGAYGGAGATGNTGATGASGNYAGGVGGASGAGGSSGGSPGFYLTKGSTSVTINNNGSIAGLLR